MVDYFKYRVKFESDDHGVIEADFDEELTKIVNSHLLKYCSVKLKLKETWNSTLEQTKKQYELISIQE